LTKGGQRCLRDLDLFKDFQDHIKVGASLTFLINEDSIKYEPYAALPNNRLDTLKILHDNGIKTWVSFEPVIKPQQTMNLLDISLNFVDEYRIGKINHSPELEKQIDWPKFLIQALEILRMENKQIYVKKDLRELCKNVKLNDNEIDMDLYLAPPFKKLTNNKNYEIKYT
jgi:DNA repair photolyase